MKKGSKKVKVYKSMREFEKKYFPESLKKKIAEKPIDARTLGINLARESLATIQRELAS